MKYHLFAVSNYNYFNLLVYNLQGFQATNLSTNLQEFLEIIVDSKLYFVYKKSPQTRLRGVNQGDTANM